ncbi:hypothetical protein HDU67_003950 [Dinochytrium kinnereticum]|nr:hypothetical protein HDU67_003950 [Dinochytrium kinnereticum]
MSHPSAVAALHGYRKVGPFFVSSPSAAPPDGSSKPQIVFLFGWMNGKMQYVNKYAKYYQERGHTVLVNLNTSKDFFFSGPSNYMAAIPLLEELGVLDGGGKCAIVHAFSNGGELQLIYSPVSYINAGTVNLMNLTSALKTAKRALKTKAIILDSTPGRGESKSAIQAFSHGMKGIKGFLFRSSLTAFFFLYGIWRYLRGDRQTPVERAAKNVVSTRSGGLQGPRLYLYSKADRLVNYQHVEAYQDITKADGDTVYAKRFEESEHVKHAAKYPNEYWGEVDKILAKCD